ncbi:basic proline-rich protein-like [Canis lupus dingo]|uniref:basic proline-rich protein-like n=1 Tax=Canis lupus dingo TaxID=286419 RepID=UPI000DC675D9|nr:basic proline-rich protein-like [Canis lupus dingo]
MWVAGAGGAGARRDGVSVLNGGDTSLSRLGKGVRSGATRAAPAATAGAAGTPAGAPPPPRAQRPRRAPPTPARGFWGLWSRGREGGGGREEEEKKKQQKNSHRRHGVHLHNALFAFCKFLAAEPAETPPPGVPSVVAASSDPEDNGRTWGRAGRCGGPCPRRSPRGGPAILEGLPRPPARPRAPLSRREGGAAARVRSPPSPRRRLGRAAPGGAQADERGAARRGPRGRRPTWRPPPPPPRRGRHVSRTQNGGTWPGFVAAARGGGERSRARRPPCCGPGGRVVARVPHSLRWRRVRAWRPGLTEPPGPRDRGPERRPPPPPPPPPGARAQPRSLGRAATPR